LTDGDRGGTRTLSADAPIETGDIGAIRAPVDAGAEEEEEEADAGAGTEDDTLLEDANEGTGEGAGDGVAKCAAGDVGADACADKGEASTENWSA
jgi:hypothetical protein